MSRLKWGIQSNPQNVSYGELLQLWQRIDALGYDSAWLFDHFLPIFTDPTGDCFEGWTMLTALGVQTQRIRIGLLVTGVIYRHPAVLANIAATCDIVTGGRLEMGIGAAWNEEETRAYGMPFPPAGERMAMLDEAAQVLDLLWTHEYSHFNGQHYTLTNARCQPKPLQQPRPPIWIGGQGEKVTLRIVAQRADGWDCDMLPLADYDRKLAALEGHCRAHGRDFNDVRKMIHFPAIIAEKEARVIERAQAWAAAHNTTLEAMEGRCLFGTPEQAAEKLMPYVERGVEHIVINVEPPYDMTMVELIIGELAPRVEAKRR